MMFKQCVVFGCVLVGLLGADGPTKVRVATFNASLNRETAGKMLADLQRGDDPQIKNVAEILQTVRPDIVLINEFDFDDKGRGAKLFQEKYLAIGQNDAKPLTYAYRYTATTNTGVHSGQDLDNDGKVETKVGSRGYGNDSFGFGQFPGQYGLVVYSQFPIDTAAIKTFQEVLWKDMPGALMPTKPDGSPWYSADALAVLRLSSKNHADVPISIGNTVVHLLVSHPTPPAFDGPEKRNAKRNHDEIRLWADYLTGGDTASYLGKITPPQTFVILGDLNSDPSDGGGVKGSVDQLLKHPKVNASFIPRSEGGPEAAKLQKGKNDVHKGDPAHDTADFNDNVGNLRADYVLPSKDLTVLDGGVFWPIQSDPRSRLVAMKPAVASSDHRLVFLDLSVPKLPTAIPATEAKDHIGEQVTVALTVASVKKNEGMTVSYLDSEDNFRSETNLAVVIQTSDEPVFAAAGIASILDHYRGKSIEVSGEIVKEGKFTRIYVKTPAQIKVVK